MDISGIREALQAFYGPQGKKMAGAADGKAGVSFEDYMKDAAKKEGLVFPEGEDVVMSHPPLYATQFAVDMKKPTEEMTLDEYKQYICNVVSGLPVSASRRLNSSGILIFKEEAFGHMKEEPEYEKAVVDMLREKYASEVSAYTPDVNYQVIGGSGEECYGCAIPVKSYGMMMAGLQASGLGAAGFGSLGGAVLGTAGSGTSILDLMGLGGYGMAGAGISSLGLLGAGMPNLFLSGAGTSGMGLIGDEDGIDAGWTGMGLSGFGTAGLAASLPGLLGIGAGTLGGGLAGSAGTLAGTSGAGRNNYTNMVNAYKKTAANQNGSTSLREYKSRWREKK